MSSTALIGPLPLGTQAPSFEKVLASGSPTPLNLADYQGKNLVMVFYPEDQTPGCTRQLCALRDDLAEFTALNTAIVGVNPGSLASHQRFAEKQGYPFPILVDADKAIATAYRALKEEGGIQRTVYILDKAGIIRYAKQGLPPDEELLAAIRSFNG